MSARPLTLSKSSADELRLRMEQDIDRLAGLARSNIDPGPFFAEVLNSALHPGGANRAMLWRRSNDARWQLAGEMPNPVSRDADDFDQRQTLLAEVSLEKQPRVVRGPIEADESGANGAGTEYSSVLIPIRYADQTVGILETANQVTGGSPLPTDTIHFFAVLCEITADFLAQHELNQLRQSRALWQKYDQFLQQLCRSLDLNSVCAAIANDGRLLAECDRVSVLVRRGRSYQLISATGVERVEPRASATRSLESLAGLASRFGKSIWYAESSSTELGSEHVEILTRHIRDSQGAGVGIVPVADEKDRSWPIAIIIFEQFKPIDDWAGLRSRSESLVNRATPILRVALEQSEIPGLAMWQRLRKLPRTMFRSSTLTAVAILAVVIAALILIPAEFTITGSAELWPAVRREVFASSSGIVDEILVTHGSDVQQGQPLIVVRDPELETDTPRIIGEIATVNERLKGAQAARFTGGNTVDANSRGRQLTADEEELKERLKTLERQRVLIEERNAALTLRSPIAGSVLTWDVTQHLSARPVERGQSLMTIGEMSGPWVVEVRVADKDAGHLLRARKASTSELRVDFMLASEPGHTYRGHVQEISQSSESDEASRSHLRVLVAFDRQQLEQSRAGATVLLRIHCGRKPIGYVWLHDLIDAIRTRLLF